MYHLVGGWFPGGNQSSLTGYRGGLQEIDWQWGGFIRTLKSLWGGNQVNFKVTHPKSFIPTPPLMTDHLLKVKQTRARLQANTMVHLLVGECSTDTNGSTSGGHSAELPRLSLSCIFNFWVSCFLLSHSISNEFVSQQNNHFCGSPNSRYIIN